MVGGPRETDASVWRRILEVNLTGAFLGARPRPASWARGAGSSSPARCSRATAPKGLTAYSASKAGLVGLAKGLALDLAPAGITVNVVAPGWFDSPLADGWKRNPELSAAITGHTAPSDAGERRPTSPAPTSSWPPTPPRSSPGPCSRVDGGYLLV